MEFRATKYILVCGPPKDISCHA